MRARWEALVALLDRREEGTSLAAVRLVVGLTIALHLLHLLSTDAAELVWADAAHGGLRSVRHDVFDRFGGATPENVGTYCLLTAAAAAAMAAGVFTRLSTLATFLLFPIGADLNSHAGGSYDELLKNSLFLLLLADTGARWSVDSLWRAPRLVPAWPRWLLVYQLVVMYFASGIQKVSDHWVPWGAHDALWYILQQPTWHRGSMEWLAPALPLLKVLTPMTWCLEVGAPVLLLAAWYRHTRDRAGRLRALFNRLDVRLWYLVAMAGMHVGIEATMEVGAFSAATLALYPACFAPTCRTRDPGPAGRAR